jgi:adenylate cyclase
LRQLARLNALRRGLIDPTMAIHSGRVVKLMGDGALVSGGAVAGGRFDGV